MAWLLAIGGVIVSLILGQVACALFSKWIRKKYDVPKPEFRETRIIIPPWLTGTVERTFFTALVAVDASGYPTAMVAWLGFKLAIAWTWPELERKEDAKTDAEMKARFTAQNTMRASRLISLLVGVVSMMFALFGGLIIRYATKCAQA